MKQYKICESYNYSALKALLIVLRGSYSNWNFILKQKDDTIDYHELHAEVKVKKEKTPSFMKLHEENVRGAELDRMIDYAQNGYEWRYEEGK